LLVTFTFIGEAPETVPGFTPLMERIGIDHVPLPLPDVGLQFATI